MQSPGGLLPVGSTLLCDKAGSTLRSSRAVPHPSTNRALRRLTSEVGRDPVHSTRYGRQRRCFLFKCDWTNALTSGPFGHLYWLARSKLRPWPLGTPQSSYPGDCSKAGGNLPHPPAPPLPPLRVLAALFSGGQFLHLGMFFLPPFGSVSPSPGALNSSASPRLLPLDPPRRPHRELNPRAPAREATSDTTRPRGLGQ